MFMLFCLVILIPSVPFYDNILFSSFFYYFFYYFFILELQVFYKETFY